MYRTLTENLNDFSAKNLDQMIGILTNSAKLDEKELDQMIDILCEIAKMRIPREFSNDGLYICQCWHTGKLFVKNKKGQKLGMYKKRLEMYHTCSSCGQEKCGMCSCTVEENINARKNQAKN